MNTNATWDLRNPAWLLDFNQSRKLDVALLAVPGTRLIQAVREGLKFGGRLRAMVEGV